MIFKRLIHLIKLMY